MRGSCRGYPVTRCACRFKGELPEGRHLRVDNKNFYFDIGQNNRGIYMKVSEVNPPSTQLIRHPYPDSVTTHCMLYPSCCLTYLIF